MIGIIGAMKTETDGIRALQKDAEIKTISGISFSVGKIGGTDCVVATCGIGKVFAAMCAQTMILTFHPERMINVGVGGALDPSLKIGEIVVADSVAQHDMDTSPLGDPKGMVSGPNMIYFPCDGLYRERIVNLALKSGLHATSGIVISGDQFIALPEKKAALRDEFKANVCEMEGAAIGQVCYMNKIPFNVLRAISDGASEDGAMDYLQFCDLAAKQTQQLLKQLL